MASQIEKAVNRHVAKHGCPTCKRKTESFTYHMEFELGDSKPSWWIGQCDICKGIVRVKI